ncbi:hypothetical protein BRD10_01155 [Halobacteriales archaeon SW_12_71_31]|nr:MAG: hypothetical protein BRD10_01155 [Halobacteriales archaeon SW_12_71_31]
MSVSETRTAVSSWTNDGSLAAVPSDPAVRRRQVGDRAGTGEPRERPASGRRVVHAAGLDRRR